MNCVPTLHSARRYGCCKKRNFLQSWFMGGIVSHQIDIAHGLLQLRKPVMNSVVCTFRKWIEKLHTSPLDWSSTCSVCSQKSMWKNTSVVQFATQRLRKDHRNIFYRTLEQLLSCHYPRLPRTSINNIVETWLIVFWLAGTFNASWWFYSRDDGDLQWWLKFGRKKLIFGQ